jgi:hypothetical protein
LGSHRPERWHGDPARDGEPDPSVADEVLCGADEERGPEREQRAERPREEADAVAEVLGDAEPGHLALVVPQRALDHRREAAEEVPHPRAGLHPHRRHEHQPPVPQEPLHPAPHLHHCAPALLLLLRTASSQSKPGTRTPNNARRFRPERRRPTERAAAREPEAGIGISAGAPGLACGSGSGRRGPLLLVGDKRALSQCPASKMTGPGGERKSGDLSSLPVPFPFLASWAVGVAGLGIGDGDPARPPRDERRRRRRGDKRGALFLRRTAASLQERTLLRVRAAQATHESGGGGGPGAFAACRGGRRGRVTRPHDGLRDRRDVSRPGGRCRASVFGVRRRRAGLPHGRRRRAS